VVVMAAPDEFCYFVVHAVAWTTAQSAAAQAHTSTHASAPNGSVALALILSVRSGYAAGTQQNFLRVPVTITPNAVTSDFLAQPTQLGMTKAQFVSFASSRSGVRIPLSSTRVQQVRARISW
jgi:hypothetical protein